MPLLRLPPQPLEPISNFDGNAVVPQYLLDNQLGKDVRGSTRHRYYEPCAQLSRWRHFGNYGYGATRRRVHYEAGPRSDGSSFIPVFTGM